MDMMWIWHHIRKKNKMGCNCSKDQTELSIKQKLRREFKKKVADIKQLWVESADGKVTSNKDQLGFKPVK